MKTTYMVYLVLQLPGFTGHPRFRPDGTHLDVINICNNMPESRAAQEHPSTSQEPLYTGHSPETMAGTVARSINAVSIMRSNRERGLTFKSYLSNDTRYAHLHEPYSEPYLGPGAYDTDYAQPGMGPLLPGTPSASAVPQRDPLRYGSSFLSPSRPSSPVFFRETFAPGSIYMDPDFKVCMLGPLQAWYANAKTFMMHVPCTKYNQPSMHV